MSGWIKLHRQLQDNPLWFSEPFSRGQAWVDLMMMANHKPGYVRVRGRRIDVGVGCVARAQKSLADRWSWSKGKVVRFLKELESDGQIEQQTSHDFNVIRLCNYEQYQVSESRDESRKDPPNGSRNGPRIGLETGLETGHIQEQQKQQECKEGKEVKKTTTRRSAPLKFKQPDSFPREKWVDYLDSRKAKKHVMTDAALRGVVKRIEETVAAGYSVDDVLDVLIETGWGRIEPSFMENRKSKVAGQQITPAAESHADRAKRLAREYGMEAASG